MATFVCIHGAFAGGFIWGRTARALSRLGHEVLTPTLTGCGERSHLLRPETSLAMHVEDVAQVLFHEDPDRPILVGHGYGGMIAAAVAHRHPGKVAGLVGLDAVVPQRGQSWLEAAGRILPSAQAGWLVAAPPVESFGLGCRELARWLAVRLQPFPRACLSAAYPYGRRDKELPNVYLRTTRRESGGQDKVLKAQAARAALNKALVMDLNAGPLPMLSSPGRLAKALVRAAGAMGLVPDGARPVGEVPKRQGRRRLEREDA